MNEIETDEIKFFEKLKQTLQTWKNENKISKNTFQYLLATPTHSVEYKFF